MGAPHRQHSANFKLIFEKIKNTEEEKKKTGKKLGSLIIIPNDLPENSVPLDETKSSNNDIPSKWDIVSPTKCAPLSMTDIKEKVLRSRDSIHLIESLNLNSTIVNSCQTVSFRLVSGFLY